MTVSVYITSYNQKDYLEVAVDSVLQQTRLPDEIIIVDDCSSDGSIQLIKAYARQYPQLIKPHFNVSNLGITKNRNLALSLVTGDYITWLDGDDKYLPEKIETQLALVAGEKANLVYTNFYYASDDLDKPQGQWCTEESQLPDQERLFAAVLGRKFPNGALFRYELIARELLDKVGGYDENLAIYEDFDFRIRMAKHAKAAYSLKPLSVYRMHPDGLSRAPAKLHLKCLQYIYKKYRPDLKTLNEADRKLVTTGMQATLGHYKKQIRNNRWFISILRRIKRRLKKLL